MFPIWIALWLIFVFILRSRLSEKSAIILSLWLAWVVCSIIWPLRDPATLQTDKDAYYSYRYITFIVILVSIFYIIEYSFTYCKR